MLDTDLEPPKKRQKCDKATAKTANVSGFRKDLQKRGVLALGLKETLKHIEEFLTRSTQLFVFVLHDKEHLDSSS